MHPVIYLAIAFVAVMAIFAGLIAWANWDLISASFKNDEK